MSNNSLCISQVAATINDLLDLPSIKDSAPKIDIIVNKIGKKVDRIFMYNPDAIALWLYQKYTYLFEPVIKNSDIVLPMLSVMPSVTPVCFGTMYTGVMPEVHGIQSYIKPVIQHVSVFDSLIEANKKGCIISTTNDSLSEIFLEREMDYFIYDTVRECNEKAMQVIEEDLYDFVLLYNANFDGTMHRFGPESVEAMEALKDNIHTYQKISESIKKHWVNHDTLLAFAPDHGCHEIDGSLGSHGLDMSEDMDIIHFYSFLPKER